MLSLNQMFEPTIVQFYSASFLAQKAMQLCVPHLIFAFFYV
jgi:hypothetical protein